MLLARLRPFLQVCIEELKKVSKDMGVKALPYAQIFKPGTGKLAGLDIPPSKVKHLRHNLQVGWRSSCKQLLWCCCMCCHSRHRQ
jgi:hypothetical protein